jgi:DNA repair protein RecO (recombination protein O)
MFFQYRTQGLIFKKEDRAEADQLLSIFTKDFGKLEILGKGIRRISSKLRSAVEIFYLSETEFIQGKTYKTLIDAILIEKFQNLRKDLKRLSIAYKISEDLDNLIRGEEPDERIWSLLNETFQRLNAPNLKPLTYNLTYYYFLWNLISALGYKPELSNCPICQKKLRPGKLYFSEKEGGVVCQNCVKKIKSANLVKPEIVKILRIILEKDWKLISKLKISDEYLKSLDKISQNYSSFILEKNKK